jgi:hypothetical protein
VLSFDQQGAGERAVGEGELRERLRQHSCGEAAADGGEPLRDCGLGRHSVGDEEFLRAELPLQQAADRQGVGGQELLGDDQDRGRELTARPESGLVHQDPAPGVGQLDVEGRRLPAARDRARPELLQQARAG